MKKLLLLITIFCALTFADAKLDSTHSYEIDGQGNWIHLSRILYSYPDASTTTQNMYIIDFANGGFMDVGSQTWTVDEYGNMTSWTTEFFGASITETITNTYENGKLIEASGEAGGFYSDRDLYTWVGDNNTEVLSQDWEDGAWVNLSRSTHSFQGNKVIGTLTEEWRDDAWENYMRISNTYNGDKIDHWIGEQWFYDEWLIMGKYYLIYDNQDRIKEQHNYDWDQSEYNIQSKEIYFYSDGSTTISEDEITPESFSLTNYPNPFNPSTNICYELPKEEKVSLQIFDMTGNLVKNLMSNESKSAGYHQITWDATDNNNSKVPTGIYFYAITTKNYSKTNRCLFIK